MKRWEPIAYPGPDNGLGIATHRNFNQSTGERGSWLDADGYQQNVIDEPSNLVSHAGLTPDGSSADQMTRAVRRGTLNYLVAGGTANALTVTLDPAPAAGEIADGFPLRILIASANTAAATLAVNGATAVAIVRSNGAALTGGELIAGQIATFVKRSAGWQLESPAAFTSVKRTLISASTTWTPSVGMVFCDVEVCGGGGGGGGAFGATSPTVSAAPGGGGGGYTRKLFTAAQIGANAAVVIGAGGAGGAAGQNNGAAGGNSTFDPAGTGATLTASGGGQGIFGTTATFPTRGTSIGAGGAGSNGDFNVNGQPSGWPLLFGGTDSYTAISGHGGDSYFGRGGQASQENNPGNVGNGYGAGGGGGAALATSTAGGNGTPGVCIITEYIQV